MGYKFLFYMIFVFLFGPVFITIDNSQYEYIPNQEIYYQDITENFYIPGKIYKNGKEIKVEILDKTVIKDDFDQDTGIHELTLEILFKRKIANDLFLKYKIQGKVNIIYYDTTDLSNEVIFNEKLSSYDFAFGFKNKYIVIQESIINFYNLDTLESKTLTLEGKYISHNTKGNKLYLNMRKSDHKTHIYIINADTLEIEKYEEINANILSFVIDKRNNLILIYEVYSLQREYFIYYYDLENNLLQELCSDAKDDLILYDENNDSFVRLIYNKNSIEYIYDTKTSTYILNRTFLQEEVFIKKDSPFDDNNIYLHNNEFVYEHEHYIYENGKILKNTFPILGTSLVSENDKIFNFHEGNIIAYYNVGRRLYFHVYDKQTYSFITYRIMGAGNRSAQNMYYYNNQVISINDDKQIIRAYMFY